MEKRREVDHFIRDPRPTSSLMEHGHGTCVASPHANHTISTRETPELPWEDVHPNSLNSLSLAVSSSCPQPSPVYPRQVADSEASGQSRYFTKGGDETSSAQLVRTATTSHTTYLSCTTRLFWGPEVSSLKTRLGVCDRRDDQSQHGAR
jgi:hypothetical protein